MGYMKRNPPTSKPRPKAGPLPPKSLEDRVKELEIAVQSWKDNADFWHKETRSNRFRQIAVDTQRQLSKARKILEELLVFENHIDPRVLSTNSSINRELLEPFSEARIFLKETDDSLDIPEDDSEA